MDATDRVVRRAAWVLWALGAVGVLVSGAALLRGQQDTWWLHTFGADLASAVVGVLLVVAGVLTRRRSLGALSAGTALVAVQALVGLSRSMASERQLPLMPVVVRLVLTAVLVHAVATLWSERRAR